MRNTFLKNLSRQFSTLYFGKMPISNITPSDIHKFIQLKINEGLSHSSINHFLILLGSILKKMVDDELIIKNPAMKVKKLKVIKKEMEIFSIDELYIVLDTAKKCHPDFYPLLFTAVATGARQSELVALKWSKINWETRQITIDECYSKNVLAEPKTKTSKRRINMSKELTKVLKEWKLRCPNNSKNLVFPNSVGNYLDANNMYKRQFLPLLKECGVKKIRFHDLRHQFVSLLITQNVHVKYIQKQMGHSSSELTMDTYSHILKEVDQTGVEALDAIFNNTSAKKQSKI
ncbi:MAG: tyrosine-type recombinase/integrase [Candidatus Gastranaerophilales bacterium]|nr:tyrosine-type recombinase/integrase [Candidatus Gastranaerophilales bacterium]